MVKINTQKKLSPPEYQEILDLCTRAFQEDMTPFFESYHNPTHILVRKEGTLISHALWITRWLQVADGPMMRTAYVEAVASDPGFQGQGFASRVMTHLAGEIQAYDLGALSPANTTLYSRLGWECWQGPLYARKDASLLEISDETVMILRTPNTPELDLRLPISIEWREGEVW